MTSSIPTKAYVGIKALIAQNNKLLLLKKMTPQGTYWDTPGGRRSSGETFEQTLKRELEEELPGILSIEPGELLGARHKIEPLPDGVELVLLYFQVKATLPKTIILSTEHSEYRWVGLQDFSKLDAPVNPQYQKFLEKLNRQTR